MTLSYTATLLEGFLLGVGLIVGIGPQNTFVLRQSLSRQHLFVMVALCVLLDALLLVLGVYGLGELVKGLRVLSYLLTVAGGSFLLYYVFCSFRSVFQADTLSSEATFTKSRRSLIVTLLATSLLNPSLYLDTLFVIGGTATHVGGSRLVFVAGAVLASLVWFASLSYGAALLAPCLSTLDAAPARHAQWLRYGCYGLQVVSAVVLKVSVLNALCREDG